MFATDGAADAIDHHCQPTWFDVAHHDDEELAALLRELHQWESVSDPDGRAQPTRSSTTTRPWRRSRRYGDAKSWGVEIRSKSSS